MTGFGDVRPGLAVYVEKRPPIAEFSALESVTPLQKGEIEMINQACGNGWRKLFNVYAKLIWALPEAHRPQLHQAQSWQEYRDQSLLQAGSGTALLFSPPALDNNKTSLHIIAGRTHAKRLLDNGLNAEMTWLDHEFAFDMDKRLFVCPYFDYRQLSNIKICRLRDLIASL